jgi:hypothetical protein
LRTFHKILAGCEHGDGEAWSAFVGEYTPLMVQLGRIYLPEGWVPLSVWREALASACRDDCKLLRTFGHQSEPEFLMDLRAFFLECALPELGPDGTTLTSEGVAGLLRDLPMLHQEIAFFKLAGYSDRTVEQILRIAPAVAQPSLDRLRSGYGDFLDRNDDECSWPGAWLRLLRGARIVKSEACPPVRTLLRLQDGQLGWYEKEPAEKHVTQCLHCLAEWTALREVKYWRSAAPPVTPEDLHLLIPAVTGSPGDARRMPFLSRILNRIDLGRRP